MVWENPVKTIQICFFRTGHIVDHYVMANDGDVVAKFASFLRESDAVIVGLDGLSEDEIERLRKEEGRNGGSLFASPDCYGHWESGLKKHCSRLCPLRSAT